MKLGKAGVLVLILLLAFVIVSAQNEDSLDEAASSCLQDKVEDRCDSLSLEEKVFTVLGVSECSSELKDEGDDNECWPSDSCEIKETAQALLALGSSAAEDWLLDHTKTPSGIEWYMQVDSDEATSCEVTYDSTSRDITINEDKEISASTSLGCFEIYNDYWLEIKDACFDRNFTVSCDKDFISTLMYKKSGSNIWYIPSSSESASADGLTEHSIDFYCFSKSSSRPCNYEDNLWAALALYQAEEDIDGVLPYLTVLAEDNEEDFPAAFLQVFTGNYLQEISDLQNEDYWDIDGKKFYDTALAILAIGDIPGETESWLEEQQSDDGCLGNIRDTGMLLWAGWGGGGAIPKPGPTPAEQTCFEDGGEECRYDETCEGLVLAAFDTDECCYGECIVEEEEEEETWECEDRDYNCRFDCFTDEEEATYDCPSGRVCCKEKAITTTTAERGYGWIWFLVILIILVALGILYRNKLRVLLFKFRSKFKKGPVTVTRPAFPPAGTPVGLRRPMARPVYRRPVAAGRPTTRPATRTDKELEETLKKLREMSK